MSESSFAAPLTMTAIEIKDGGPTPTATFQGIALGTDGNLYTATGTGKWKKVTAASE